MAISFLGTYKECKAKAVEVNGGPIRRTMSGECKGVHPIFRKVDGFAESGRIVDSGDSGYIFFRGEYSYRIRKVHRGLYEFRWFLSGTVYRFAQGRGKVRVTGSSHPVEIEEDKLIPFDVFVLRGTYEQHIRALVGWVGEGLQPGSDLIPWIFRSNFPVLAAEAETLGIGDKEWFASIT